MEEKQKNPFSKLEFNFGDGKDNNNINNSEYISSELARKYTYENLINFNNYATFYTNGNNHNPYNYYMSNYYNSPPNNYEYYKIYNNQYMGNQQNFVNTDKNIYHKNDDLTTNLDSYSHIKQKTINNKNPLEIKNSKFSYERSQLNKIKEINTTNETLIETFSPYRPLEDRKNFTKNSSNNYYKKLKKHSSKEISHMGKENEITNKNFDKNHSLKNPYKNNPLQSQEAIESNNSHKDLPIKTDNYNKILIEDKKETKKNTQAQNAQKNKMYKTKKKNSKVNFSEDKDNKLTNESYKSINNHEIINFHQHNNELLKEKVDLNKYTISSFNTNTEDNSILFSNPANYLEAKALPENVLFKKFENGFNPNARFFIMKSNDEDNIYKSIKYRVWCSSFIGNKKLNEAFKQAKNEYPIYLIFGVNRSGRFVGISQMISEVNFNSTFVNWNDSEKYKGYFFVVWVSVKDVPSSLFVNIKNKFNSNETVIRSRNNQEIDAASGYEILKIFRDYPLSSSILDDLIFFEMKEKNKNPEIIR